MLVFALFLFGCHKEVINFQQYDCEVSWEDDSANHPKAEIFQSFLNQKIEDGLTGVMMSIQTPDGIRWTGSAGKVDIALNENLKSCHQSRVGSITKTFTATIILKLVEEELLQLDEKINTYLPESIYSKIDNHEKITIRHLLNHSSGIRDYTTINGYTEFINNPTKVFSTEEYLELNVFGKDALFEPGTDFKYSNANYGLLGIIAEKVSGEILKDLYDQYIIQPLGLYNTVFTPNNSTPDFLARGYMDFNNDGKIIESTDWGVLIASPAAGIISNTYDLLLFEQALHNGEILNNELYQEMTTLIDVPDPKFGRTKYGLGLRFWETDYGDAVGHSGGMYGYLGEAFHFPELNVTYTLLVNCSFGICNTIVDEELNDEVLKLIFE